jgi:Aspartyl protease
LVHGGFASFTFLNWLRETFVMIRSFGIYVLFVLVAGCSPSSQPAESGARSLPLDASMQRDSKIAFVLTEANNISIPAVIDHRHPVKLMFHTGVDAVSLTKDATSRLGDLKLDKSETVTSWGGKSKARYGDNHSIQMADLSWERVTIGESDLSGPTTDGKFGPNLFSGKIVAIDFDTCTITLHDKLPEIDAAFQRLDLIVKNDLMIIEGSVQIGDKRYKNKFMIHSGFGGTLLLDDEFVNTNQLAELLPTTSVTELKDSFGNIVKTRNVLLPSISFGNFRLNGVTVGLFDAALGKQKQSLLGGNILKRFNIVLNLKESHIYLKPNKNFGDIAAPGAVPVRAKPDAPTWKHRAGTFSESTVRRSGQRKDDSHFVCADHRESPDWISRMGRRYEAHRSHPERSEGSITRRSAERATLSAFVRRAVAESVRERRFARAT